MKRMRYREQREPRAMPRLIEARCRLEEQLQALARERYDLSFTCYGAVDQAALRNALERALHQLPGRSTPTVEPRTGLQIHPEDRSLLDVHARCVVAGQHDVCVVRVVDEAGEVRWVSIVLQPVMDEQRRQVVQVVGWLQDLSGQSMPLQKPYGDYVSPEQIRAHA